MSKCADQPDTVTIHSIEQAIQAVREAPTESGFNRRVDNAERLIAAAFPTAISREDRDSLIAQLQEVARAFKARYE